jgi:hypothetical protein
VAESTRKGVEPIFLTKAVTHPAEDVLAALLGSSREIEIDFPGGKVRADGRSVRRAGRKVNDEE